MRNILYNIQPLRGWEAFLPSNPAFHTGLVKFNPFGINFVGTVLSHNLAIFAWISEVKLNQFLPVPKQGGRQVSGIWLSYSFSKIINSKSLKDLNFRTPDLASRLLSTNHFGIWNTNKTYEWPGYTMDIAEKSKFVKHQVV